MAGTMKWGYGCQVGVYAQHVYTTLPENERSEEYLEHQAAPGTNDQQIKDVAGSFLFSGEMVEKKIRVLSGGERARLVLAGLLLQAAQRAGARRTGQPPRRRIGRSPRRRAQAATPAR